MKKMSLLMTIVLLCSINILYSQESSSPDSAQAPWFYYWPQEDADNFALSSLDSSNIEPTQRGSSLNTRTTDIRSNQDANKPLEGNQKNTEVDTTAVDEYIAEVESINQQGGTSGGGSGSNIYKWVDGNGEVHVTNNPASIPPEFRDQATVR